MSHEAVFTHSTKRVSPDRIAAIDGSITELDSRLNERLTLCIVASFVETTNCRKTLLANNNHGFDNVCGFERILELKKEVKSAAEGKIEFREFVGLESGCENVCA